MARVVFVQHERPDHGDDVGPHSQKAHQIGGIPRSADARFGFAPELGLDGGLECFANGT